MLRIGIIGCGKITQVRHAPEYAENTNCELTAFYDAIPERAQALAKQYGGRACASVEELLDCGLDAVSVCSANTAHAQATIAALDRGVHVLCEKPMATTLAHCEAMAAAAKRNGRILMLGHNQRFARAHVKAREIIASGRIGRVLSFHTMFGHPGPEGWTGDKNSWFMDKRIAAFGTLADLGIHKTDLIQYLTGEPIVRVSAALSTVEKKYPDGRLIDVDDNAYCLYTLRSGAVGTMHVSWTNFGAEDNSTRIYGSEGVLRCYDDPEYSLILERKDGTVERMKLDLLTSNKEQTSGGRTNTGVIDEFVDCVLNGREPRSGAESAIAAMRVIFAAEQSALTGKTIDVKQD